MKSQKARDNGLRTRENEGMTRTSYRALSRMPAWLLYKDKELIASVRAQDSDEARRIFKEAGLTGTHMRLKASSCA